MVDLGTLGGSSSIAYAMNDDGQVVGIITDRDLREHAGYLDRTEVKSVMTKKPTAVTPASTLEMAAQLMLERKIGGLPVMESIVLAVFSWYMLIRAPYLFFRCSPSYALS